jgi:hypothetical protein
MIGCRPVPSDDVLGLGLDLASCTPEGIPSTFLTLRLIVDLCRLTQAPISTSVC